MKTIDRTRLTVAVFSLVIISTAACTKKPPRPILAQLPEKTLPAAVAASDTSPSPTTSPEPPATDVTLARWSDIKDDTYEQRAHFQAGLKQLITKVAVQMAELNASRVAMQGTTTLSTNDWDFAMREMTSAQSYFAGMEDEINKATPETWNQKKDKVGVAWKKTQDAYDKVKHSTTN